MKCCERLWKIIWKEQKCLKQKIATTCKMWFFIIKQKIFTILILHLEKLINDFRLNKNVIKNSNHNVYSAPPNFSSICSYEIHNINCHYSHFTTKLELQWWISLVPLCYIRTYLHIILHYYHYIFTHSKNMFSIDFCKSINEQEVHHEFISRVRMTER